MDNQPETAPVLVTVTGIEAVTGAGAVVALAIVDVEIAAVAFQLQGVRVVRRNGGVVIEAPQFRHPRTGLHIPAVVLPAELAEAIAAAVLEALQGSPPGGP